MKVALLAEQAAGERRVAATPETVKKLIGLGAEVAVETGAGTAASIDDAAYAAAGATIGGRAQILADADIVLGVAAPAPESLSGAKRGAWLLGSLNPFGDRARIEGYAALGLEALAMEWMPRITRAQSMDILSSQANLAGYKAVLDAASEYGRAFPMMMTAAGTISAARVFVMGVGVAGLQAIATARRLGAQVSATDVRSATREQILSLGAKPIFVEKVAGIEGEGAGGYAGEMSAEYQAAQAELVSAHIAKQDIVITTALIPGRPAPRLISDAQIASMRPGSVIVDLAVEQGGNVEGSVAGEVVQRHGVNIVGHRNVASRLAADASALFARNLYNFLAAYWDKDAGRPILPADDEVTQAIRLTQDGQVTNTRLTA
ncbi:MULTISPECIES: Re/Si-specific NAD(P)(+) transhydrogenase subunit alpha [Sphingomonas]|uniref:proton-translocating NAD(P)(+) transhydrogenase n=1 Tax=Sphingomonas hankookensis TaxID=563996 RepID=A0ABR5YB17_9SPHN|nr:MULTISPECIES: Re/Si-specific NAD(P)(+) transhydrogenase subunit alpha [Sphingomonas]KZE11442.1 NAD(P) transhydrogenase subunit alpha [Sphingomonas hankookensis]PZT92513.1 MAG: Re/Si-specific NAD(P)(+) transhydrogenase subunit alpha [Sphingomonas sp.]RSV22210.1 Re/Si-specific NAD(P)(+) transhydrogenase subunit alpha [Sphingomonas sp. ABOLH]WCP72130.1 Re/Si-specific NAD(P)(+) transhydrogenase subunit alpha [Sphingomonas hankookensis]